MRIAIHQPEHMPWLGFFDKMASVDCYVVLDDVQFTKNNFQNRNRIRGVGGDPIWLTVPVRLGGHTGKTIKDMEIAEDQDWRKSYWGKLLQCYGKFDAFKTYKDELFTIISGTYSSLMDFNLVIINFLRREYKINTPIIFSSSLNTEGYATEKIVNICRVIGASEYISGQGGRTYLDERKFKESNIELTYHKLSDTVKDILNQTPGISFSTIDLLLRDGKRERTGVFL